MAPKEKATFFQYSVGQSTDLLTLGTLIWRDYANPELARHWSCPKLSQEELEQQAYVTSLGECVLSDSHSREMGLGLDVLVGASVNLSLMTVKEKCVAANSGSRVVLKDATSFVSARLAAHRDGRNALILWLSAARDAYYSKMRWARRPKVWVLTGYYELQGAQAFYKASSEPKGSIGIDSLSMGALTTVPIGASISLGNGTAVTAQAKVEDSCIWAARYQMLQLEYLNVSSTEPSPAKVIQLLPNVFSQGTLRSSDQSEFNAITEPSVSDDDNDDDEDEAQLPEEESEATRLMDVAFETTIREMETMLAPDPDDDDDQ